MHDIFHPLRCDQYLNTSLAGNSLDNFLFAFLRVYCNRFLPWSSLNWQIEHMFNNNTHTKNANQTDRINRRESLLCVDYISFPRNSCDLIGCRISGLLIEPRGQIRSISVIGCHRAIIWICFSAHGSMINSKSE